MPEKEIEKYKRCISNCKYKFKDRFCKVKCSQKY